MGIRKIVLLLCVTAIGILIILQATFSLTWDSFNIFDIGCSDYELMLEEEWDGIDESWTGDNVNWTQLQCYIKPGNKYPTLKINEPVEGESIFFHETACPDEFGSETLRPRDACAVESAALHHPDKDVFVLFVAPVTMDLPYSKNVAIRTLRQYKNIHLRHIHLPSYIRDTPLRYLLSKLQMSDWAISHASDVLRYTTLFKYRGIYLDLDTITLKRLPEKNYAGAESEINMGAGVINFGSDAVGKKMADLTADEIARTFNGKDWGNNGPKVLDRVLFKACKAKKAYQLWDKECMGFKIFHPKIFYPVSYKEFKLLFQPQSFDKVQTMANESYLIHYWGKFTANLKIDNPKSAIYKYAKENCPKVFQAVKETM